MSASGASKLRSLLKGHQEQQDTAPPLTSRYIRVVNTFDVSPGARQGVEGGRGKERLDGAVCREGGGVGLQLYASTCRRQLNTCTYRVPAPLQTNYIG